MAFSTLFLFDTSDMQWHAFWDSLRMHWFNRILEKRKKKILRLFSFNTISYWPGIVFLIGLWLLNVHTKCTLYLGLLWISKWAINLSVWWNRYLTVHISIWCQMPLCCFVHMRLGSKVRVRHQFHSNMARSIMKRFKKIKRHLIHWKAPLPWPMTVAYIVVFLLNLNI